MKSTGIIRKVDELGRIVIPIELRNSMGISSRDPLEIYVDGESIVLRKSTTICVFCGKDTNVAEFKGRPLCGNCAQELRQMGTLNQQLQK